MQKNGVKILGVISGDPFSFKTWSGISYYLFSALRKNGWLYEAVSAQPAKIIEYFYKLVSFHPEIEKWKFKYHINTNYFNRQTKSTLKKINRLQSDDYNVILQIGAWYDFTKMKDKKTVSYHDGNFQAFLDSPYGYPNIHRKYIEMALTYEKELYMKMDRIFTMSKWLATSFVRDFGVKLEKVIPVGAGINLPYVKETTDRNYDECKILFIGVDFERKGGKYLIEAFKKVKKEVRDARLTIIGPTLSGLPQDVKCLNFISKNTRDGLDTLLNEYASSSIFVMPSLYEPFGIVFLEAMAHRLPCIGTNVCAMPEIIDHGVNGFVVPPHNSELLAERMIELLKCLKMCKEMGDHAYKKYCEYYTWNKVARKMIEAIP